MKNDLTGRVFGRLQVIRLSEVYRRWNRVWFCRCECGVEVDVKTRDLTSNNKRSCGCLRRDVTGALNRRPDAAPRGIFASYKSSARQRGHEFSLTYEQAVAFFESDCFYCGSRPDQKATAVKSDYLYNGIDRVDNSVGYVHGNVVCCCKTCNRAKYQMSVTEFTNWIDRLVNFRSQQIEKGELQVWQKENK
jgi:hypothetical protein